MFRNDLGAIHHSVMAAFPKLSTHAQALGLHLYRMLLERDGIRPEEIAAAMNIPSRNVRALLNEAGMQCQILYDKQRQIVGFGGLTTKPTVHRLTVGNSERFTWCAWDALFIPQLIGATEAEVESQCPITERSVRLTVFTDHVARAHEDIVMAFVLPNATECAASAEQSIGGFCDHVRLLESTDAGAVWIADRKNSFLLRLADAFELGRLYNEARFGPALEITSDQHSPLIDVKT